jgi:hypothetical protein
MFLMLGGVAKRIFENNPTHVLVFYRSKVVRQQAIHIFFELFVK